TNRSDVADGEYDTEQHQTDQPRERRVRCRATDVADACAPLYLGTLGQGRVDAVIRDANARRRTDLIGRTRSWACVLTGHTHPVLTDLPSTVVVAGAHAHGGRHADVVCTGLARETVVVVGAVVSDEAHTVVADTVAAWTIVVINAAVGPHNRGIALRIGGRPTGHGIGQVVADVVVDVVVPQPHEDPRVAGAVDIRHTGVHVDLDESVGAAKEHEWVPGGIGKDGHIVVA